MKHLFILVLITFSFYAFSQEDIKGSQDHPLFNRLPDFHIKKYIVNEYDAHQFYNSTEKVTKEGKKYRIEYRHNEYNNKTFTFPGRLQILRNYSNAIVKAGGKIVFEKKGARYGNYTFITKGGKEIWLKVEAGFNGKSYKLIVIEIEGMRQDVVITSDLIKNQIESTGRVAIYDIYFDVGKSELKPESEPALIQMAEYLQKNPTINCWIVGHTDSDGSFETNSILSLERAKAVKSHLETKNNISASRLFAEGVGPLSPLASNKDEEGKKLNRRVELVKK